jgi:hypothetical protein
VRRVAASGKKNPTERRRHEEQCDATNDPATMTLALPSFREERLGRRSRVGWLGVRCSHAIAVTNEGRV